ncbi:zinc ABC transporter substrate-binding protein [Aurantimonas sp. Leaf443]|uniref:zinc ABC transporter substrate-binding protein n=1 Tax=Aurantimonas sp. Leaf443 TaxID=1736378 RepID=UPI0007002870|nr:zinc ABC transporter substrate-binding protein [Aurantimonas sp. Leaf443]KQT85143.1 zinc transporter [Aurantimonas sp. Leaf443]
MRSVLLAATCALALATPALAEVPGVVVSIKPIGSLVSQVMEGVGEPHVIVAGAGSPHTYAMKPSDAAALDKASLVFWMGPTLEAFLEGPIETLGTKARIVALSGAPGVQPLPFRTGGAFEMDEDEDAHGAAEAHGGHDAHGEGEAGHEHGHEEGTVDMHMWLDPQNAKAFVATIADELGKADPDHAARYAANAKAASERLDALQASIAAKIAPVKDRPFVVFHDAYQYFDRRFGLRTAGSVTVSPETAPGARRLAEIRAKIAETGAACVFSEPQFESKFVSLVLEGSKARSGTLDPEGATMTAGPGLYDTLLNSIADSLVDCLSKA